MAWLHPFVLFLCYAFLKLIFILDTTFGDGLVCRTVIPGL